VPDIVERGVERGFVQDTPIGRLTASLEAMADLAAGMNPDNFGEE